MSFCWKLVLTLIVFSSEAFASPCMHCGSQEECARCLTAWHADQETERVVRERFKEVQVKVAPRRSSVLVTEPFDVDFVITNSGDEPVWFNWDESCQVGNWQLDDPHVSQTKSDCGYTAVKKIELSHGESFRGKYEDGLMVKGPVGRRLIFKIGFQPSPVIEPQWSNDIVLEILARGHNKSPQPKR